MSRVHYSAASYSHVGMVRKINEDACLELTWDGLWAVADGMGGHAAGDYVSSLAVDSLRQLPLIDGLEDFTQALRDTLARVNRAVREETLRRGVAMMGSTVVVLAARGDRAVGLWAGDSRLYRLRDGRIERLSHDHSYVQELQDSGLLNEAEARVHPRGNIVTRAIGVEDQLELQAVDVQVQPGDTYLLCSDGLNKTAEDHEIADVLGHADPYQVVRSLVHLGLTRGAPDNITAVVVKAK
ncbi:protein phosphatase 2C domain-containing protein [Pseudomonas asiatica]|uniref:Serine/threonine protein phosphatase n=2 Tax=Pseudomonas TaxID=286 RepID=A0A1L5PUP3_PSEPU|nr:MULTISPECIES: protein phosphatase 2C domain-containing protein [Pseudomonas]MEE1903732.1 protein phosphatase 2C domain-containing protein [Pseudomonas inefficax]APO83902.1 serine/threonine protein phosphatase [Pseudomonas putida]MDD2115494.1 protein phosphatase 2C domain-containing protein [Pseudomonas asiatica]MEE1908786.1 protein phosphatase 2C domain-containing protein [Pseudomonas inefficax]MEE1987047.1 protein phosphatase 2C domain-containing protein [Pseudomonas inefficax]